MHFGISTIRAISRLLLTVESGEGALRTDLMGI